MTNKTGTTLTEQIRISGTPEAIKEYLADEFLDGSKSIANKVLELLIIEDAFADEEERNNPNISLESKSIKTIGVHSVARGMFLETRLFFNVSRIKIEILKNLPWHIFEILLDLSSGANPARSMIRAFFNIIKTIVDNMRIIGDNEICVCMLAWRFAEHNRAIPFSAKDIMPDKDNSSDKYVCSFLNENGQVDAREAGAAHWLCKKHPSENSGSDERYCHLQEKEAKKTLDMLVEQGVLRYFSLDKKEYIFL